MSKILPMPFASDPTQQLKTEYIDNLATSTWYDRRSQLFTDIWQITPLLDALMSKGRVKMKMPNGRYFEIPFAYRQADANQKWFGRGDTFSEGEEELWTVLQYQRKNLGDSIVRYWDDDMKNKSKAQVFSYIKELINNHQMTMESTLASALWAASPAALAVNSLPALIPNDPTTGTVGGLDRSTSIYLRNQTASGSGKLTADTLVEAMANMFNTCSLYKGQGRRTPDLILTTQTIYEYYEEYVRGTMGTFEWAGNTGNKRADLGLGGLSFKGAEMYWDPECPSGTIYFLNTDTMEFLYDPDAWMEMTPWKSKHNSLDRYAQVFTVSNLCLNTFVKNGVIHSVS
jgi:hypothetical protein